MPDEDKPQLVASNLTIKVPCNSPAPLVLNGGPYAGCQKDRGHFPDTPHEFTVSWT